MANMLASDQLKNLVTQGLNRGWRVIGPVKEKDMVLFSELTGPDALCLDMITPRNSIKEFFFPKCEAILSYKREGREVSVTENLDFPKTLIIGARPCDARSLAALDPLFDWDYRDAFFFKRREATTVVSMACKEADDACFCTSLGFGPRASEGADLLLVPTESGDFLAEGVTEKGEQLITGMNGVFTQSECGEETLADPEKRFDLAAVRPWLENNFDHDFWDSAALACLGCGTCTFLCPTCHCFDIVDEGGHDEGVRLKNWDTCQMKLFTLHTSGHNPRETQAARWRQRIRHKFQYYVEKFQRESCVGCGRCIRHCPVGMNIIDQLQCISALSSKAD